LGREAVVRPLPARPASSALPTQSVGVGSRRAALEGWPAARMPPMRPSRIAGGPATAPVEYRVGRAHDAIGPPTGSPSCESHMGSNRRVQGTITVSCSDRTRAPGRVISRLDPGDPSRARPPAMWPRERTAISDPLSARFCLMVPTRSLTRPTHLAALDWERSAMVACS